MNRKHITFWMLAISVFVFAVISSQAIARGYVNYNLISVEVISDERGPLTKYDAGAESPYVLRDYVIARDNERYGIRIRNRSNNRIGLVIAVDGRNIISGQKSHLDSRERMYILGPYEAAEYHGWRTGKNRINRFYFTEMNDSYAAAWGDYSAMGVIAVAAYRDRMSGIFGEKGKPKNRPFNRPWSNARRHEPGTGFGEAEWSPSRTVEFSPQGKPFMRQFIKYEWRSTLCKRGVIKCRHDKTPGRGNRFWPDHRPGNGFAPFPPDWRYR